MKNSSDNLYIDLFEWSIWGAVVLCLLLALGAFVWTTHTDAVVRNGCSPAGEFRTRQITYYSQVGSLMLPIEETVREQRYQCPDNSVWLKE